MGWNEWSTWLKGGVIGFIILIILIFLDILLNGNYSVSLRDLRLLDGEAFYFLLYGLLIFVPTGIVLGGFINYIKNRDDK